MNLVEPHWLTGVWALNALDGDENAAFEQHLDECESCRTEAAEMRETATRLSMLVEVPPPVHLRARVLAAAATTRQLSPESSPSVVPLRPRRPWMRRATVFVAAASVLGAVGFGVQKVATLSGELTDLRQVAAQYEQLNSLMTAPDAKTLSGTAPNGASGLAVYSPARGKVVFLATALPALPDDRAYQVWVIDGAGPHSAGVLAGVDRPVVAALPEGAEKLAVTVEPRGGSEQPTTEQVMAMPLV